MSNDPATARPTESDDQSAAETSRIDPQAAAELSQEISLLTRALFAQLLPATAAIAVSGIAEPDHQQQAAPPSPAEPAHAVRSTSETSVPLPSAAPSLRVAPPPLAADVEAAAASPVLVPMPPQSLPLPDVERSPDAAPATAAAQAAPAPSPLAALPVPGLPVEGDTSTGEASEAPRANRPRSLAVLEEIAFLDE